MAERGAVLWVMSVLLGLLGYLAVTSLQAGAQAGLEARQLLRSRARTWHAEALAGRLARLPIPAAVPAQGVWQPATPQGQVRAASGVRQGRAQDLDGRLLLADAVTVLPPNHWRWQLQRLPRQDDLLEEGTDVSAWPERAVQRWALVVEASDAFGSVTAWRHDFLQQAAP